MTPNEKRIYNTHLVVSRSERGKPFRLRDDFSNFEDDPKYNAVRRISVFAAKYPDIDLNDYFKAPYVLYPDTQYFDLAYFASPRAIKSYTIFKQELEKKSPDSMVEDVKNSLRFIGNFCLKNNIDYTEYTDFVLSGLAPEWMYHIKNRNINIYALMEFPGLLECINKVVEDEQYLLIGPISKNFIDYKNKYHSSLTLRPFLQVAHEKVKFFVDKNLKK